MSEETNTPRKNEDFQQASREAARRMTLVEAWKDLTPEEKSTAKKTLAVAGVGAAMTAIGIAGISSGEGGNDSIPDASELSPTIYSVVLNEDANLRFDPYAANPDTDANNLVLPNTIDPSLVEIKSEGGTYVLTETSNGAWYGMKADAVLEAFSGLPDDVVQRIEADKDGVIWVNEQGVADVKQTTDTQLPTLDE